MDTRSNTGTVEGILRDGAGVKHPVRLPPAHPPAASRTKEFTPTFPEIKTERVCLRAVA
jgi:hypothetical protein